MHAAAVFEVASLNQVRSLLLRNAARAGTAAAAELRQASRAVRHDGWQLACATPGTTAHAVAIIMESMSEAGPLLHALDVTPRQPMLLS